MGGRRKGQKFVSNVVFVVIVVLTITRFGVLRVRLFVLCRLFFLVLCSLIMLLFFASGFKVNNPESSGGA